MNDKDDRIINSVEAGIRLALLASLLYFCFKIISPFIELLCWGVILATTVHPLFVALSAKLKGRQGLTAGLMVAVTLMILIIPLFELGLSLATTVQSLSQQFAAGSLKIPVPNEAIKEWPVVGERLYNAWVFTSSNLKSMLVEYRDQLGTFTQWLLSFAGGVGGSLAVFILSTFVAATFLAYASESRSLLIKVVDRLADEKGHHLVELCTQTVRSVAQGVIGVALIQALLAAIGFIVMDVPGAGLWVTLILVLAVVQLPPILVFGPIMIYVFSVNETLPAVLFMIYGVLVSASDAFLKPLFLGRGMAIPMPVILVGAIGGVIVFGILGLFIGAVILAVAYSLFLDWLGDSTKNDN